ncbi:hypothetical protein RRG08_012743 [Elysia crispata]|uniref:G-protein coupled receptors family 1 profile domain-containing protein n=1 Tax=Elysia crispata TaxID=231223 RepID=A0AAE0ZJC3_9GAST|nr:hypothetical protein RRG08_012743 [Elysia crispata]
MITFSTKWWIFFVRFIPPLVLLGMSQGKELNPSARENDTILGSTHTEPWVQYLEREYHSAQPVFSWALVGTGCIGTTGNILTLIVFAKMGWASTFQISCTALAASDLCCVLAILMCGITSMSRFGPDFTENTYFYVSNILGVAFSRTTALITAWISLERCLCVTFPMKVKLIITRRVTAFVLVAIFTVGASLMVVALASFSFKYNSSSQNNTTSLTRVENEPPETEGSRQFMKLVVGLFLPILSWVSVITCTTFLIVKLKEKGAWRRLNARAVTVWSTESGVENTNHNQALRVTEKRAVRVVLAVAGIFLVFTAPVSIHLLASFTLRDYFLDGSLRYLFILNSMVCTLLSQLNSSINIIVFSVLGYNFRTALLQVLSEVLSTCCGCRFSPPRS